MDYDVTSKNPVLSFEEYLKEHLNQEIAWQCQRLHGGSKIKREGRLYLCREYELLLDV